MEKKKGGGEGAWGKPYEGKTRFKRFLAFPGQKCLRGENPRWVGLIPFRGLNLSMMNRRGEHDCNEKGEPTGAISGLDQNLKPFSRPPSGCREREKGGGGKCLKALSIRT